MSRKTKKIKSDFPNLENKQNSTLPLSTQQEKPSAAKKKKRKYLSLSEWNQLQTGDMFLQRSYDNDETYYTCLVTKQRVSVDNNLCNNLEYQHNLMFLSVTNQKENNLAYAWQATFICRFVKDFNFHHCPVKE